MAFESLKVGDIVCRMIGGTLPMKLQVTHVTSNIVTCGTYLFDRLTGAEIDDYLGWGPSLTGSYIYQLPNGGNNE